METKNIISYETFTISGHHMIADIKEIENDVLLNDMNMLKELLDKICSTYNYIILKKTEHQFEPHGCTILYMLSESHISIHTFPEKKYIAFDIYTCRPQSDNSNYERIYNFLVENLKAKYEIPTIIVRSFH